MNTVATLLHTPQRPHPEAVLSCHAPMHLPSDCSSAAGLCVFAAILLPKGKGEDETGRLTRGSRGQLLCQLSAVGFEPTRSCLQWILSPPP